MANTHCAPLDLGGGARAGCLTIALPRLRVRLRLNSRKTLRHWPPRIDNPRRRKKKKPHWNVPMGFEESPCSFFSMAQPSKLCRPVAERTGRILVDQTDCRSSSASFRRDFAGVVQLVTEHQHVWRRLNSQSYLVARHADDRDNYGISKLNSLGLFP